MKELTIEQKAKAYDEAKLRMSRAFNSNRCTIGFMNEIFPELVESEDEKIRRELLAHCKDKAEKYSNDPKYKNINAWIAWLEKQGEQRPIIEMKSPEESLGISSKEYNDIINECLYGESKPADKVEPKEYTFKSLPRLLDMIEPTNKAKAYCQKLIDTLVKEGYATDAKIVEEVLKGWNGEKVAMAVMDEQTHISEVNDDAMNEQLQIWFNKGKCSGRDEVIFHPENYGLQKQGKEDTINVPRTEYEKGGADATAEMKSSWDEEDEKIRKAIIFGLKHLERELSWDALDDVDILDAYAWLEKQGTSYTKREVDDAFVEGMAFAKDELEKQGRIDNCPLEGSTNTVMTDSKKNQVEPKFKVGEWVILTAGELSTTLQIVKVDMNKRLYWFNDNTYLPIVDEECLHLWTIQDAKDGDVLVASDGSIFLFAGVDDCACKYYVALATDNYVKIYNEAKGGGYWETSRAVYPATKEQRDLLFERIKEAGYEWDAEKKEVRKFPTPADVGFAELGKAWEEESKNKKPTCWSEEDEDTYNRVYCLFRDANDEWYKVIFSGCYPKITRDKVLTILKSLKPQSHWKPSEEQMRTLQMIKDSHCFMYQQDRINIKTLLEQLKSL